MSASNVSNFKQILINSNDRKRTVDLTGGTVAVNYYEDIFSPTITAKITVVNTGNTVKSVEDDSEDKFFQSIYNGLPLRGGERILLQIQDQGKNGGKKGLDFGSDSSKYLYVSSITNVLTDSNRESFTLNLVSREAITNETARVQKKYDKNIKQSVESILKNVLKTNLIGDIEETANEKYSFIGNLRKPFTVLIWLASKAIPNTSSQDSSAGFFFYQTQDGFNFKSIDSMIGQTPKETYTYSQVQKNEYEANIDNNIITYLTDRNQNLIEKLRLGAYSSQGLFFNPATFTFTDPRKSIFKFNRNKIKNLGTSGKISLPPLQEGSNISLGEVPTRITSGVVSVGTLEKGISTQINADATKYQAQSIMRYNMLMTQTISMTVPCNTDLRAGDVIKCQFPKLSEHDGNEFDSETSGLYIIKELCHSFEPTSSFTSMKLVRDNFGIHKE